MKVMINIFVLITALGAEIYAGGLGGVWKNENVNTHGFSKLIVSGSGTVRAVGNCRRKNRCRWGKVRYTSISGGFTASWERNGAPSRVVVAQRAGNSRLRVVTHSLYCNGRGKRTEVSYFRRQNSPSYASDRSFTGRWISADPFSGSVFSMRIGRNGQLFADVLGRCRSFYRCDWGRAYAHRTGKRLIMRWYRGYTERVMTIRGLDKNRYGRFNRLRVKLTTRYRRGRVRREIFYMRRIGW